jgi:hypothetical protein
MITTYDLTERGLKRREVSFEEFLAVISQPEPEQEDNRLHFYSSVFDKKDKEDINAKT